EPENLFHRITEAHEAGAAGIAFIAAHHACPLFGGHGAGTGIRQQINQDVFRSQQKKVVVGGAQKLLALKARGPANRFNALDEEGLNDGADGNRTFLIVPPIIATSNWHLAISTAKAESEQPIAQNNVDPCFS